MLMVRKLSILLLALVISGCSRTELLYENAAWLATRWTSKLVAANSDQRDAWRVRFDQLMAEHQNRLLPEVVALLGALTDQLRTGLTVKRLNCLVEASDHLYREHARLAVPLGVQVLSDLTPEQVVQMTAELEERNREFASDYLQVDRKRRQRERMERYVDRIERWAGDLSSAQLVIVRQALADMPETADDWLVYRRQQQRHLIRLLQQGTGPAELKAFLSAWWVHFADRPAQFAQEIATARYKSIELAVKLYAASSSDQRKTLRERLVKIRDDLQGLDENHLTVVARPSGPTCNKV